MPTKTISFENFYNSIQIKPGHEHEYIKNKYSYLDIYRLAYGIKNRLSSFNKDDSILIFTEKKEIIASTVLTSLFGGPKIVFPHALSSNSFNEIRELTEVKAIITDENNISLLPGDVEIIQKEDCICNDEINLEMRDPDTPFIQLFTGGSMGKPKIWSKTPRNIFFEALFLQTKFNITEHDSFISTVPPYHIYGLLFSIIIPFISSASVLEETYVFPNEIIDTTSSSGATILVSVPISYRSLKNHEFKMPSLRIAFSSAGMLDKNDGEHFFKETGLGITEVYGSTETGGIASRCRPEGEEEWFPFEPVEWIIEDERLLVSSEFISPEIPRNSRNYYITGDKVKKSGNKNFILLGRADGVVKIAGNRVDMGDVQNKIRNLKDIRDAFIFSIPSNKGRENDIAALIVSDLNENEIKKALAVILETFAMPRRIIITDGIPVLSTGKYERACIIKLFNQ